MRKPTVQEKFWSSSFGNAYIKRNTYSPKELDKFYTDSLGISRSKLNKEFLGDLGIKNILEVGCNIGNQLVLLQKQGFKNLYGIEIFDEAVEEAKKRTKNINIIQGSAFDLPFKDEYFDLVYTAGVLIHINPKDLKKFMSEIYRVSKKYIWGYEFYNDNHIQKMYRGNKDRFWKADFAKIYLDLFPDLKLIKRRKMKRLADDDIDDMFLLKK